MSRLKKIVSVKQERLALVNSVRNYFVCSIQVKSIDWIRLELNEEVSQHIESKEEEKVRNHN